MSRFRLTPPRVKLVENDVERACVDLLRLKGYYVVRLRERPAQDSRRPLDPRRRTGPAGLRCVKSTFPEVKRPGGN